MMDIFLKSVVDCFTISSSYEIVKNRIWEVPKKYCSATKRFTIDDGLISARSIPVRRNLLSLRI